MERNSFFKAKHVTVKAFRPKMQIQTRRANSRGRCSTALPCRVARQTSFFVSWVNVCVYISFLNTNPEKYHIYYDLEMCKFKPKRFTSSGNLLTLSGGRNVP